MSYVTKTFDEQVVGLLKSGGVGFMPSDTIYGLSCRALDSRAVERLYQIKQRDQKPFIVLISKIEQLADLSLDKADFESVFAYWPGKLSAVGPAKNAPDYLHMGTKTLAIRWPNNPGLIDLIDKCGPLISTSANMAGQKPLSGVQEAQKVFGDRLDFYVDAGQLADQASTVVRIDSGKLKIIRQGEVKIES